MEEKIYWLGFSVFPGIGPKRFGALLSFFGSAKNAWFASPFELEKILGIVLTKKFDAFRLTFSLKQYVKDLKEKQVSFTISTDKDYPNLLKEISDPPFVLYVKGNLDFNQANMKSIGVVGTRKITSYGVEVTKMLANDLVQAGCVIVSGLALGVDTIAHQTTLDLGGKTIAVLGCGVDLCYPSANQRIYNSILATGGVVVSEYPLGMQPSKGSFPSRNRIIAGLSDAVLVTEGAEDSGALITAKHALDFGRSVFAVPGPITSSLSKGPFTLIQKGAKLATSGHDVLEVLGIKNYELRKKREKIACETKEEQMIIDLLENESLPVDELIKKTKMHASEMSTLLSFMELKGVVTVRDNFVAIRL